MTGYASNWIGLDIGGANIKVALSDTEVDSIPFPLWKQHERLESQLKTILRSVPMETGIAVTMTGELADCFPSRECGVKFIVDAVANQCTGRDVRFYDLQHGWDVANEVASRWQFVAAANWHAIARYFARYLDKRNGFLVDMGSTTTDIIPIRDGRPAASGNTDVERLTTGELVYAGVERTPLCSIVQELKLAGNRVAVAREFFATIEDVFVFNGDVTGDRENRNTADGRPATREFAAQRLARMVCSDAKLLGEQRLNEMAIQAKRSLMNLVGDSLQQVVENNSDLPRQFVVSGQGEWFARAVIEQRLGSQHEKTVGVSKALGSDISRSAAAYSVARLANEDLDPIVRQQDPPAGQGAPHPGIRVIKVGGSLFPWADARPRIETWLKTQTPMVNVWVAGGGELVDYVRKWNERAPLEEQVAHWICVDLMSISTRLMGSWFSDWPVRSNVRELECIAGPTNCLFDPSKWLREASQLDESWNVTSDSCAAELAEQLGAAVELVLLKYCDFPSGADMETLSRKGIVDPAFTETASTVAVIRLVNLRSPTAAELVFENQAAASG